LLNLDPKLFDLPMLIQNDLYQFIAVKRSEILHANIV